MAFVCQEIKGLLTYLLTCVDYMGFCVRRAWYGDIPCQRLAFGSREQSDCHQGICYYPPSGSPALLLLVFALAWWLARWHRSCCCGAWLSRCTPVARQTVQPACFDSFPHIHFIVVMVTDHPRSGVVYNFGRFCLSAGMYGEVCVRIERRSRHFHLRN